MKNEAMIPQNAHLRLLLDMEARQRALPRRLLFIPELEADAWLETIVAATAA